jgi:large subunit ribosomal protein L24
MQTGGIVEKEAPLPISSLQYVCEKCKAPTRLRRSRSTDGVVHRVCARCDEPARESAKGA